MRTSETIGDRNEETIPSRCTPQPVGIHSLNSSGTRRARPALDHYPGPFTTLTEHVVDFLERYNKAIYGLG